MCTADTTCIYAGHCECGGCPCDSVTCYHDGDTPRFNPWRFRIETMTGAINRRRPNPRRRIRNFIQKYYFFARDVNDTASFRQRYSLVRKFQ